MEQVDNSGSGRSTGGVAKYFAIYLILTLSMLLGLELVLEIRAYSRGYDTVFLGKKENTEFSNSTLPAKADKVTTIVFSHTDVGNTSSYNSAQKRYWIASASHALYGASSGKRFAGLLCEGQASCASVNGSVAGWTIEDSLRAYHDGVQNFNAQIVLLYHLSMDLFYFTNGDRVEIDPSLATVPLVDFSELHELFERFTLYSLLKSYLGASVTMQAVLKGEVEDGFYERLMMEVAQFTESVRKNGQKPVLVTFPMPWTTDDEMVPYDTQQFILKRQNKYTVEAWFAAVDKANNLLRKYADEEGVLLVDLARKISGKKAYFKDLVHLNAKGHQTVADTIKAALDGADDGI